MKVLLTIALIIILFRLVSRLILGFLTHGIRKNIRTGGHSDNENASGHQKNKKKKIFRQDDGDYVDYEELEK